MKKETTGSDEKPNKSSKKNRKLYEPGIFWKKALEQIENRYIEKGIKDFRSDRLNLSFFVPTYGCPGNTFDNSFVEKIQKICKSQYSQRQLKEVETRFDGSKDAYADYRAFKIASIFNDPLGLLKFSESKIGSPTEHFNYGGSWFSRSSLNYLLGLCFLFSVFPKFRPKRVLEIGGGFGTLAEILGKSNLINLRYLNLDLNPMFSIAKDYVTEVFIRDKRLSVTDQIPKTEFSMNELETFSFFPNSKIEYLTGTIDLFVNFISFQEMEPEIVKNYANNVVRLKPKLILIRNLREGKQIQKGDDLGVKTPILKENYLEMFSDYSLAKNNVLEFGHRTADGFNSELLLFKRK